MKCEICNGHDAETAITLTQDGEERELYVCRECARQERVRRQKKSQRTRKGSGSSGVSISVTRVDGDGTAPPLFIEALMNAVHGMVSDLEKAEKEKLSAEEADAKMLRKKQEEAQKQEEGRDEKNSGWRWWSR